MGDSGWAEATKRAAQAAELMSCWSMATFSTSSHTAASRLLGSSPRISSHMASAKESFSTTSSSG